jgi:hypothetical protein
VGLTGEKLSRIMPLNYGKTVRCMTNTTLSSGQEVTFFASDDGYVYQDSTWAPASTAVSSKRGCARRSTT